MVSTKPINQIAQGAASQVVRASAAPVVAKNGSFFLGDKTPDTVDVAVQQARATVLNKLQEVDVLLKQSEHAANQAQNAHLAKQTSDNLQSKAMAMLDEINERILSGEIQLPDPLKIVVQNILKQVEILLSRKMYQAATIEYNEAIKLSPSNPAIYEHRGFMHASMRFADKAIVDFEKFISLQLNISVKDPQSAENEIFSFIKKFKSKCPNLSDQNYNILMKAYDALFSIVGKNNGAKTNNLLLRRGKEKLAFLKPEEAAKDFQKINELKLTSPEAFFLEAQAWVQSNNFRKAVQPLKNARDLYNRMFNNARNNEEKAAINKILKEVIAFDNLVQSKVKKN